MSAAQQWNEADHPRGGRGTFVSKPAAGPAPGGAFLARDPRGTFAYPDPTGFDGSAEDFVDFFSEAEVDDAFIASVSRAYRERAKYDMDSMVKTWEDRPGRFDPEGYARFDANPKLMTDPATGGQSREYAEFRLREKAIMEDQNRRKWPLGRSIQPYQVRDYVRAVQAMRNLTIIDQEERRKLRELPFPNDAEDGKTLLKRYQELNAEAWLDDWVDRSGL